VTRSFKTSAVLLLVLLLPSPAIASVIYTYDHLGLYSFSFEREQIVEDFFVFNDPYDGHPDGPLLTLTEPTNCNITQVIVDALFNLERNEIEVHGFCTNPFGLMADQIGFNERFDHLGTYAGLGGGTLTIAQVPDPGPTWLVGALGMFAVVVMGRSYRRVRRAT
jgi:hypothetical protein